MLSCVRTENNANSLALSSCQHHTSTKPPTFSQGISTPESCYPEFNGDSARSFNTWDFIAMSEAALSPLAAATAVEACQAACAADPACQYYVFWAEELRCLLRNKVPHSRANVSDTSKSYVLFEVSFGAHGWLACLDLATAYCHTWGDLCHAGSMRR